MATTFSNTSSSSNLYLHRCRQNLSLPSPSLFSPFWSSRLHPQTLFLVATPHRVRRIAVAPLGPPTPPSPDPPPPKNTTELTSSCLVLTHKTSMFQLWVRILLTANSCFQSFLIRWNCITDFELAIICCWYWFVDKDIIEFLKID